MLILVFQNFYYIKAKIGNAVSLFQQFFVTFIQIILNKVLITEKLLRKDKIWHAYKKPKNISAWSILLNLAMKFLLTSYCLTVSSFIGICKLTEQVLGFWLISENGGCYAVVIEVDNHHSLHPIGALQRSKDICHCLQEFQTYTLISTRYFFQRFIF